MHFLDTGLRRYDVVSTPRAGCTNVAGAWTRKSDPGHFVLAHNDGQDPLLVTAGIGTPGLGRVTFPDDLRAQRGRRRKKVPEPVNFVRAHRNNTREINQRFPSQQL